MAPLFPFNNHFDISSNKKVSISAPIIWIACILIQIFVFFFFQFPWFFLTIFMVTFLSSYLSWDIYTRCCINSCRNTCLYARITNPGRLEDFIVRLPWLPNLPPASSAVKIGSASTKPSVIIIYPGKKFNFF